MFYVQILLEHIFAPKCKFIIQRTLHTIDLNMLASYTYLCIMVNSHTHTHTHACKHIPTHTHTHTCIQSSYYYDTISSNHIDIVIRQRRNTNNLLYIYKKKHFVLQWIKKRYLTFYLKWNWKKNFLTIMISISHN